MKLPNFIFHILARFACRIALSRKPDEVLYTSGKPYMQRWFVIPHNRYCNIYVHNFLRSDDDRALHDHPWPSASILLIGEYAERLEYGLFRRREGHIYARRASCAHRIQLMGDEVLTLFITGPHVREWGFHCPNGWRHWKIFTKQIANGKTAGCGDYE